MKREQEQRENLAQTLRTLRADENRNTITTERLEARNEELSRQLAIAQSQERSAKLALRTAEASAKALREEMAKLKGTVQQIRASCANDIRKRDVQIQRLKSHLTEQQRGNKTGLVGASITISPGLSVSNKDKDQRMDAKLDINDPAYSLKQETTEFLTQLSQSLSDENDNLIGLVRRSLATLKELQGLPANAQRAGDAAVAAGLNEMESDEHMLQMLPTSYDALSNDMDLVLDNLKTILTNPNYVPIEEVTHREEEIIRLRQGWEKMETRWKEAILLMDGWRTRMLNGGDTINLEEIKMGLGLAEGIPTTRKARLSNSTESLLGEQSEDLEESGSFNGESNDSSAIIHQLEDPSDDLLARKPVTARAAKQGYPLQEANGNSRSPRKVAFDTEPTADENASQVDLLPTKREKSTYRFHPPNNPSDRKQRSDDSHQVSPRKTTKNKVRFTSSVITHTSYASSSYSDHPVFCRGANVRSFKSNQAQANPNVKPSYPPFSPLSPSKFNRPVNTALPSLPPLTYVYIDPLQTLKRLSSPSPLAEERSPKLTIQEKLNVAQAAAEAAAMAAINSDGVGVKYEDEFGELGTMSGARKDRLIMKGGSPIKKIGLKGRPKRRKSTLTPDELEALMFN